MFADPSERCEDNANSNDNSSNSNSNDNEGCIPDPCTSEDAVIVKHVVWRPELIETIGATPTPQLRLCLPPYSDFVVARKCSDCPTQADAQRLYQAVGGPRVDIYDFDRDKDGIACEDLPRGQPLTCVMFASQAQAQQAYIAAGGANRNTDNLDPDRNGIACEELP
jgi:hypothetical protein